MRLQILDFNLAISTMPTLVVRIGKFVPWRGRRSSDDHLLDELERLALLSPHLLVDLGFRRDASASASGTTVWRRGQLRVVVASFTKSVFASTN